MRRVRILRIPEGASKDAEGRGVGDDWLLAQFGRGDDGALYYLTTDGMHASDMVGVDLSPRYLAELLEHALQLDDPGVPGAKP
jgi:hypothetical protein